MDIIVLAGIVVIFCVPIYFFTGWFIIWQQKDKWINYGRKDRADNWHYEFKDPLGMPERQMQRYYEQGWNE